MECIVFVLSFVIDPMFQILPILLVLMCLAASSPTLSSARQFNRIPLPIGVVGPESVAFDCHHRGPYVGVSDGRILRYEGHPSNTWTQFAVMPNWHPGCDGSPDLEPYCGRPLGLKFHPHTCELYVADAYNGLVVIPQSGGRAVAVASTAEGTPFKFTNALDIASDTGIIYFTDSSTRFGRREFGRIFDTVDSTARLMSYNPRTQDVEVLLRNLRFANGVAMSRDNGYLLVSETSTGQVHKVWLKGLRAHTSEMVIGLRGRPDNINRDANGDFWIAQVPLPFGASGDGGMPVRIDGDGRILERLDGVSGELVTTASDVLEFGGRVWIGSVVNHFVQVSV